MRRAGPAHGCGDRPAHVRRTGAGVTASVISRRRERHLGCPRASSRRDAADPRHPGAGDGGPGAAVVLVVRVVRVLRDC
ncbi:hypothetical protein NOCARDAX2BIS_460090 [Nocardioides sp. AX2bis]|nr:hypothetical protein NOCARDAX2BIS_460090 [Nocardioides sp. AX2bis]